MKHRGIKYVRVVAEYLEPDSGKEIHQGRFGMVIGE